jgi:uncharacterized protein YkwD
MSLISVPSSSGFTPVPSLTGNGLPSGVSSSGSLPGVSGFGGLSGTGDTFSPQSDPLSGALGGTGVSNPDPSAMGMSILQMVLQLLLSMLTLISSLLAGGQSSPISPESSDLSGIPSTGSPSGSSGGDTGISSPGNSPSPSPSPVPSPGSSPGSGSGSAGQQQFLQDVNELRAQHGLAPVKLNSALNQTATDYSQALQSSGQFTHELNGSQFGDRIKQHGYQWGSAVENIAKGMQDPDAAFQAWVNSPEHLANMLSPDITEIGVGNAGDVWTMDGAKPS